MQKKSLAVFSVVLALGYGFPMSCMNSHRQRVQTTTTTFRLHATSLHPPQTKKKDNKAMAFLRKVGRVGGHTDFTDALGIDEGPCSEKHSVRTATKTTRMSFADIHSRCLFCFAS